MSLKNYYSLKSKPRRQRYIGLGIPGTTSVVGDENREGARPARLHFIRQVVFHQVPNG